MLLKDLENNGMNRFHLAACSGTINQIPDKLLTLENLLTKDNDGLNVFHSAVQHGTLSQIPTCFLTIDNLTIKVDRVSGLWCSGWTSFHFAAYCGNLDQLPQEMLSEEILLTKAADGKSVYKLAVEGKSLKQIPKKLAAVLKGLHKPKKSDPGCPAGVYSWLKGGIMAVECIDEKQRSLVGCQKILKNDACLLDAVAVIDEIDSGNWVVAHCGLFEEIPTLVSKKLKTKAAFLYYDDTSGLYGYSLFLNGKRQEEITSESDVSELLTTHKQSGIAAGNHRGFEDVPMALIDNRFRDLGICLPVSL
jgi:hypothetical protein